MNADSTMAPAHRGGAAGEPDHRGRRRRDAAGQRSRVPDPAHHGPGQGGAVFPAGCLRGHCRGPGPGPVRRFRLAGRGERQPGRRSRGPGGIRCQGQRRLPAQRGPRQRRAGPQGRHRAPLQGRVLPGPDRGGRPLGPGVPGPALPAGGAGAVPRCWPSCRRISRPAPWWWWSGPPARRSRSGRPAWTVRGKEVRGDPALVRRALRAGRHRDVGRCRRAER